MGTLRLMFALSVVLFHSGPLPGGWGYGLGGILAVESFFVVSGFYIALILDQRYRDGLGAFYWNRFVRIFPLYWVVFGLYLLAGVVEPSINRFAALQASDPSAGTLALMLSANLLLFGSDLMLLFSTSAAGLYFAPDLFAEPVQLFKFHYLPQAWSLPLELYFYALAPWLVRFPRRLLVVAVLSGGAKYAAVFGLALGDPWIYRFFPFELWLFCLGALAFHGYRRLQSRSWLAALRWPLLLGMVAALVCYARDDSALIYSISSWRYAGFLLALLLALPVLFAGFKDSAQDRWLGELSYPIYLVHLLVIGVVKQFGLGWGGDTAVPILLGCMVCGPVLVHAAVRPIERRLKRVPGLAGATPAR